MTAPSHLGAVLYEAESTFGEDSSLSSPTRLNILNEVDTSGLTWEKQDINPTRQYRNEGWHHVRGPKGGSFTIRMPLSGHGSATTGSLTATNLATLLGYVVGNSESAASGTTVNDVSASATSFDVDSAGSAAAGHLFRAGELGDGAAEGQGSHLNDVSGSTFTFDLAFPAAPADSDNVYAMETVYPHESSSSGTSVTGLRFGLYTADQQYLCHGCFATAMRVEGLNTGELPMVEIDFQVSWWEPVDNTFPVTETLQEFAPPNVGAGSLAYNDNGTSTRQTLSIRDFTLEINLDVVPIRGPGGVDTHQAIIGANRRMVGASISFTVDSESSTTTPTWLGVYDDAADDATYQQFLYTASVVDGSALAFYFPSCTMTSPAPVQQFQDGLTRIPTSWACHTNVDQSTATSDLWLAAFKIGLG